jgi:hypothetical protein
MAQFVRYETRACCMCGKSSVMDLEQAAFVAWKAGVYVQDAFPMFTPDQREVLITGTHPECWDALFPDEESSELELEFAD